LVNTERGYFMPKVILHVDGTIVEQQVKDNANLVVLAGIRQFPQLKYGCGMGRCTKCTCRVISGGESIAPPNWKEIKMLGDKVEEGYRLTCQLTIEKDIEISQENISIQPPKKQSATLR
jgi:ferredoxin